MNRDDQRAKAQEILRELSQLRASMPISGALPETVFCDYAISTVGELCAELQEQKEDHG